MTDTVAEPIAEPTAKSIAEENGQADISGTTAERLTSESGMEYLKAVIDPEIFQNIVDLGLVYGVEVDTNNAAIVTMTLTTPHCPMGPQIIADVEQTLKAKGASDVTVNIVWEPMWTPAAMTEELQRELGIVDDEPDSVSEIPEPAFVTPEPPKKRGFLSRLFGRG